MQPLTEHTFFQFVKCPDWIYRDVHERAAATRSDLKRRLLVDGMLPETSRSLLSDRQDLVEIVSEDQEEAFFETVRAMRAGRGTIFHPVLVDGSWVARPDFLERVEGTSRLGGHYYVAVDVKRARSLREEYQLQGCFYADMLYAIQGVKPLSGYVLTPDRTVLSYALSESETAYRLILSDIERIRSGERPEHLLTSGCKQSPWFDACVSETQERDDIGSLNRLWKEEAEALRRAGYTTVHALAEAHPTILSQKIRTIRGPRLQMLRDQAIAMTTGKPIFRARADFPVSDREFYFDIESDPLRDQDFLFGLLCVENGSATYHPFLAKTRGEEEIMWQAFCTKIQAWPDAPLYHYGFFEQEVVNRFLGRFGASEEVRAYLTSQMIDILERLRPVVHFPFSFYSLKDIAKYIGYTWKEADVTGATAVEWFEAYVENPRKRSYLSRILAYNEDDVRATWAVKTWLERETAHL